MTDTIAHASEADVHAIAELVDRSYRPTADDAGVSSPMQSDLLVRSMVKHRSPISG
jgi:hypothetical protein